MLPAMSSTTPTTPKDQNAPDQWVTLRGISWRQYESLVAMRGDQAGVRIAYLDGVLEFRSPSRGHEWTKTLLGRLIEAYAEERGIELTGYGSWTVRRAIKARGVEPDECYVLGSKRRARPDLAIEIAVCDAAMAGLGGGPASNENLAILDLHRYTRRCEQAARQLIANGHTEIAPALLAESVRFGMTSIEDKP